MKRILEIIAAFVAFAVMTLAVMMILIGAVMYVVAFVTDLRPTDIEQFCIVITMLMGGAIGAVLFAGDTKE